MFKTALKSLLGHKFRLVITSFAIVLGVGFMAGTFVLTDTLQKTFDNLFNEVGKGTDAVVRGKSVLDQANGQGALRPDLDPALALKIDQVDGVRGAEPLVQSIVTPLDKQGKAMGGGGAPNFGFNWSSIPQLNTFDLAEGKPPTGPDQIVISRGLAKDGPFTLGDTMTVQTLTGKIKPKIVGIATFNGEDSAVGATFVLMDTASAIENFSIGGKVQEIDVVADPGVSQTELVRRIQPVLPAGVEAITGDSHTEENKSDTKDQLAQFNVILGLFAAVALVAGAFLIYNTFGIILAQRTRELALLRALGAGRRQVLGSVVLEAGLIGLVSSIIGLFAGVAIASGLFALFKALGLDLPSTSPVLAPRTIVVTVILGLGITILSALAPAWKASKVPPIAALRDVSVDSSGGSRVRLVIGLVLAALGALVLFSGVNGEKASGVLGGVGILFVAAVVLGPRIAPAITHGLGFAFPRLAGAPGRLARENAARNPKRSASTASALLLSVTIVTMLSIFAFSFGESINGATDKYLRADFQLDEGGFGFPTISPKVVTDVAALPQVAAASGVQFATMGIAGTPRTVYGVDGASVDQLFDIGLTDGTTKDLGTDGVAVDNATASLVGWKLGTKVPVTFPDGKVRPLTVKALYDNAGIIAQNSDGHYLVDSALVAEFFPAQTQYSSRVLVKGADGYSQDQVRAALDKTLASTPIKVRDKEEIKKEQNRQLQQSLAILVMLLVLSVVIGGLGIANTLALSVFERTRELGLLRAVGSTRRQVNVSILLEAMLLSLFGTLLGMVLGIIGGSGLIETLGTSIPTASINIPIPFLVAVLVVAFVIGVASSVIPSWRASRLNVLDAIATE